MEVMLELDEVKTEFHTYSRNLAVAFVVETWKNILPSPEL